MDSIKHGLLEFAHQISLEKLLHLSHPVRRSQVLILRRLSYRFRTHPGCRYIRTRRRFTATRMLMTKARAGIQTTMTLSSKLSLLATRNRKLPRSSERLSARLVHSRGNACSKLLALSSSLTVSPLQSLYAERVPGDGAQHPLYRNTNDSLLRLPRRYLRYLPQNRCALMMHTSGMRPIGSRTTTLTVCQWFLLIPLIR